MITTVQVQTINMNRVSDAVFRMRPLIEKALAYSGGGWTFQDVADAIMSLKLHFWVNDEAFAITEVISYPQYSVLHIFLSGGKLEAMYELEKSVAAFGRDIGCKRMTFLGREGFARKLPSSWKKTHIFMYKDIGD